MFKQTKLAALVVAALVSTTTQADPTIQLPENFPKSPSIFQYFGGTVAFDEIYFSKGILNTTDPAKPKYYESGAKLKTAELSLSGQIIPDFNFVASFNFDPKPSISVAYVQYQPGDVNWRLKVGQVPSSLCLEASNSGKWIPFMERSLALGAIIPPCLGLGFNLNAWGQDTSIAIGLFSPRSNDSDDRRVFSSDRTTFTSRAVYAPRHDEGNVVQFGLSYFYRAYPTRDNSGNVLKSLSFSARPELRSRKTDNLFDTGSIWSGSRYGFGLDFARISGPFYLAADIVMTKANQLDNPNKNLYFYGGEVSAAYVITGQTRVYDYKTGTVGPVLVKDSGRGAWEVSARLSYLDLNSHNIQGGRGHSITLGTSYYFSEYVRCLLNYVYTKVDKATLAPNKQNIHGVGARIQVVW